MYILLAKGRGYIFFHFLAVSGSAAGRRHKLSGSRQGPAKMSEKEQVLELERKLERNRQAFEAWLDRKAEERRVRVTLKYTLETSSEAELCMYVSYFDSFEFCSYHHA